MDIVGVVAVVSNGCQKGEKEEALRPEPFGQSQTVFPSRP